LSTGAWSQAEHAAANAVSITGRDVLVTQVLSRFHNFEDIETHRLCVIVKLLQLNRQLLQQLGRLCRLLRSKRRRILFNLHARCRRLKLTIFK